MTARSRLDTVGRGVGRPAPRRPHPLARRPPPTRRALWILGPFNLDRDLARRSFRRLGGLELDAVCFGHGPALLGAETAALAEAAAAARVPDPLG